MFPEPSVFGIVWKISVSPPWAILLLTALLMTSVAIFLVSDLA
jgi:hypothetical protein